MLFVSLARRPASAVQAQVLCSVFYDVAVGSSVRFVSTAPPPKPKRVRDEFDIDAALALVKENAKARFDESFDIAIQLGVDPRKPGQNIRGIVQLPHGTGRKAAIAVFARGEKAEEAKAAGALVVGAEDLVAAIQAGNINFTKCIATPDMMPVVGKVARLLGPKGLMPNPKLGTVTNDIKGAVQAASKGQIEYRVERQGIVMAGLGRVSFTNEQLKDNLKAFMIALSNSKPEQLKGQFLKHASVSSTMGPGFIVSMAYLNPSNVRFMQPASAFARPTE